MADGADHKRELNRLKRIEGQVRGVANMIERHDYCIDILNQLRAVRSSLKSLEVAVLEKHLHHCVHDALGGDVSESEIEEKIEEITELFKQFKN